ncbi:MAG TPA: hypothetical protein VF622_12120 [Segetibacter sp.]
METTRTLARIDIIDIEPSAFEVTGIGKIQIRNTGGASSSEGGMGSGSDDDTSKGDLSKPGERSGTSTNKDSDNEEGFDPIGKNIKEKERENESGKE